VSIFVGGLIGAVLGAVVWRAAGLFAGRFQPERIVGGLTSLPAAVTLAGMAAWGAVVACGAANLAQAASALVVVAVLAAIALTDLQVRQIPNALVLALLAWAAVQVVAFGRPAAQSAGLGLLAGGGLFVVIALISRGAMGAGDVKLAAALGAVFGWPVILPVLLYGIIAGGVAALILLVTRRAGRKSFFAYGPYLALGAAVVLAQGLLA